MRLAVLGLVLASVVMAPAVHAAPLERLKALYPTTPLWVGGQPRALLVAPESLGDARDRLQRLCRERAGIDLPSVPPESLVADDWAVDLEAVQGRTLVALGSINDNRLLAVLWGAGTVVADSIYPGPGGYAVRTVHDPFSCGVNVLALTGSDAAGVARAVEAFAAGWLAAPGADLILPEPVVAVDLRIVHHRFFPDAVSSMESKRQPQYSGLDYFQKLFRESGLMDDQGQVVGATGGDLTTVTGALARLAQTWFLTGNPALPPLMKAILDANRALLAVAPPRREMEAASAAHRRGWDLVEELPCWTDQDRLDLARAFLADARQGFEQRVANTLVPQGFVQVVDENHGTHAALNTLDAWGPFATGWDLPESQGWMKVVEATFAGQAASHQILEDACGYLCYCPIHSMTYAFATRDLTYFRRGIARGHAEFIAQCSVSNLGLTTGFGDDGNLVEPAVFEAIAPAAWFHRDPHLAWVLREALPQAAGLRIFQNALPVDLSVPPVEPEPWNGLTVFPIFQQTLRKGEGAREIIHDPRQSAGPEWFSKIVFRERFHPDAQYLLLDGAGKFGEIDGYPSGPAGHRHEDVNTIITFTDQERLWLVDHTYAERSIKDHSGLVISRDGRMSYRVHEARLSLAVQSDAFALTTSAFTDFSGATWERTLLWERGRRFMVLDRAIAGEAGEYRVRGSFRGLGTARLEADGLHLEQDGKACVILADGRARLGLSDHPWADGEEKARWYRHAEPVVRVFRQDRRGRLEPGQSLDLISLIEAGPSPAALAGLRLRLVAATAALVEAPDGALLGGTGTLPGDSGEAGAFMIRRGAALLGALRRLGPAAAPLLAAEPPVTLEAQDGVVRVTAGATAATLRLAGVAEPLTVPAGQSLALPPAPAATLAALLDQALPTAETAATEHSRTAAAAAAAAPEGFGLSRRVVDLSSGALGAATGDLDGDGRPEVLTGGTDGSRAWREDGGLLWHDAGAAACRVLAVADLDGDGRPEVVTGDDQGQVRCLDAAGQRRWEFTCRPTRSGTTAVDWIRIADLDGDGAQEVLIGAAWVHCLQGDGALRWERSLCVWRGSDAGNTTHGSVADVDGDGALEVVALFAFSYPKALVLDSAGRIVVPADYDNDRRQGVNIDLPLALAVTDLQGRGGPLHWLVGGPNHLHAYWAAGPHAGASAGRVAGAFTHLAVWPATGGAPWVGAATDLGAVQAYRAEEAGRDAQVPLRMLWSQDTDANLATLWAGDSDGDGHGEFWAGTADGAIVVYDAVSGRLLGRRAATGSPVTALLEWPSGGLMALRRDGPAERLRRQP